MRRWLGPWLALVLLLALHAAGAEARVDAQVDRERLSLAESLLLTIRVTGSLDAEVPDLSALERDFELLGTSRNSSFSIGGGQRETATEWQITLAPRRSGQLRIPPLAIAGEQTRAITITVDNDAPHAAASGEVRLEVDTDHDELYVQQQLLLTVRVLHAVNLNRGATLEPPAIDDALVQELGENTYTKTIAGRRFAVFERRYAVFAQRSGELLIPSLGFRASVGGAGGWFDQFGARAIRLRSPEKRLRVLPPVDAATPWLPARVLTLVETWDKDPQTLRAGDSATRTITLRARGLTAAQLPPLPSAAVDGLRFYPDQPRLEDTPQDDGVLGSRSESAAVIAGRAGRFVLPPIELRWWDTQNRRFETALIPERTLEVTGATGSARGPTQPLPPSTTGESPTDIDATTPDPARAKRAAPGSALPWMITTLLFALATLFSGWQWWRATRARPAPAPATTHPGAPDEAAAFAALQSAAGGTDPARLAEALARWGAAAFPGRQIRSAGDAIEVAGDPGLSAAFEQLLASAYGADRSGFDTDTAARLLACVTALRAGRPDDREPPTGLPPLYPV
ncbi:MAG: hypothetical protein CALGDGBN_01093 [Pseudomonadales bacterium]|nr:hypothetical protein [Pseudomonadales bacterium]